MVLLHSSNNLVSGADGPLRSGYLPTHSLTTRRCRTSSLALEDESALATCELDASDELVDTTTEADSWWIGWLARY